jgi:hypothetical protein
MRAHRQRRTRAPTRATIRAAISAQISQAITRAVAGAYCGSSGSSSHACTWVADGRLFGSGLPPIMISNAGIPASSTVAVTTARAAAIMRIMSGLPSSCRAA